MYSGNKVIIIIVSFLLIGCNSNRTHNYFKNDQISNDIRQEIKIQNNLVELCLASGDISELYENVFNDELRKQKSEMASLFSQLNLIYDKKGFTIKDEFYIPKFRKPAQLTMAGDKETPYEYKIELGIGDVDSYVSLLEYNSGTLLIGLIYRKKKNEDWKLQFFGTGQYSIMGQLPWDLYLVAKEQYRKEYLTDALLTMSLANQALTPNNIFRYQNHNEIQQYARNLDSLLKDKYIFPLVMEKIETSPKILQIHPQQVEDSIYPMIRYLTTISLDDTVALKKENDLIQQYIGDYFYGLDKEKKFLFYTAHDIIPMGGGANRVHGFIQELGNE